MLREYRHTDIDSAVGLYMDNFSAPPFNYDWLEKDRIYQYFDDMEHTPGFKGFVYESDIGLDGLCVGGVQDYFACCAYEIKELIVARDCRGRGVGTEFMYWIEKQLAGVGVEIVSLATGKSLDAYGFYKKIGYMDSDSTVWMGKKIE